MTVALCLGGGPSLQSDLEAALSLCEPDYIIACNDAGTVWPGPIDAWVTLHPEKLGDWRAQREANGYMPAAEYLAHGDYLPEWCDLVEFLFPGQVESGSSGMMAAKVALCDFGADRAILCGIPMDRAPHFFGGPIWEAAVGYRAAWQQVRSQYRARIRSMGGWTAEYLGKPDLEWLAC